MRREDWRERLLEYVEQVRREPFEFGAMDCALFVAGCIEAMTGEDLAEPYRGKYATMDEGLALMRSTGYADYVEFFRHRYEAVPVAFARVGDVAILESDEGPTLGVVGGPRIFLAGEAGLVTRPLTDAVEALRV